MTTFTARVELQNADPNDYKKLQNEMQKESFVAANYSTLSGNVEFKTRNKESISEAIDAVLRAASKTDKKFSFTVMKEKNLDKLESRVRYLHHH